MAKKEKLSTESYKGVRDFYPEEQALLNYILATWRGVAERFGYEEYGASILESSELYKAKGADNEEIVNEQTYTFIDRGGREVTLRPEMTPTVARMVARKRRELGYPLRWYSIPNCFRYERPQRGRLREFWQFNADIFGSSSLEADAELTELAHAIVIAFGGTESDFVIKLGSRVELNRVAEELKLDEEQRKKFLSLLDRKNKMETTEFEAQLKSFGASEEMLYGEPPASITALIKMLKERGISNAEYDPSIVRGFAYYTDIMFEVFDTHPDNSRALMGGGRYDNLTQLFDDEPLSGVGFAIGDATMRDFMEVRGFLPEYSAGTKVYVAVSSKELLPQALKLARMLRKENVRTAVDFGEKKLGEQIKTASKHKIPYLIVVGEDELARGEFKVKDLVTSQEKLMQRQELSNFFLNL